MSFDTYANLQTEILAKLVRTVDTDAIARAPSWITLAEDEMRLGLGRLKVRQGETVDSAFSIASEFTALPAGYFNTREILLTSVTPRVQLEYVTPQVANAWDPHISAGTPRFWTIQGNQLRVFPSPSTTFTARFTYYALPSLSVSNTSNWLLTAHPKVYYRSALCEAYEYYDDLDNAVAAAADRDRLLSAVYTSDGSDQQGTVTRVRVNGRTP